MLKMKNQNKSNDFMIILLKIHLYSFLTTNQYLNWNVVARVDLIKIRKKRNLRWPRKDQTFELLMHVTILINSLFYILQSAFYWIDNDKSSCAHFRNEKCIQNRTRKTIENVLITKKLSMIYWSKIFYF